MCPCNAQSDHGDPEPLSSALPSKIVPLLLGPHDARCGDGRSIRGDAEAMRRYGLRRFEANIAAEEREEDTTTAAAARTP